MPDFTYRPLAFTAPQSGTRLEFTYDGTIEDGVSHNLGEFQFSGVDEKYFQDRSLSSDAYGFTLLLDDQDDLRIVRAALNEKASQGSPGSLEHPDPTIGTFPVVTSSYKVTQNSVKGIGIISVQVVWFRTIPDLVGGDPSESSNPASAAATRAAIDELNTDQAEDFEEAVDDSTGRGFAALVERTTDLVEKAQEQFASIASQVDEINIEFTSTAFTILSTADELARAPFDLARQIQNLIQLPMLAIDSAAERIDAYQEYVNAVLGFSNDDQIEFDAGSPSGKNILAVSAVAALAAVSAVNYSAVSTKSVTIDEITSGEAITDVGYLSRTQIIDTIQAVRDNALGATETLSGAASGFGAVTFFKQYFDYSILNKNIVASTIKNLNGRIFDTSREITETTEKEEPLVVVTGRLYGSVETNTVEFFAQSNDLHGDELFLVPKGKELIYYR